MPGIVVGLDGSRHSEEALAWAIKEAALRHTPLTALAIHPVERSIWTGNPVTYQADEAELDKIRQAAEELVQKAFDQLSLAAPEPVTVRTINGFPAEELINASRDANMVVVGSRGGGGFSRLALGSVSSQVAAHASCPVVVIPHHQ